MKKNIILVPTDFTKVAECALNHALKIAETANGEVVLLHVVGKNTEVDTTKKKVESIATEATGRGPVEVKGVVRVGNIFDDIGDAAREMGARVIVMGTHGVKGIQHLTGSYALKVITNSAVPFIVVQEKNITEGYKNIVMPLDLSKETKQKLRFAAEIAKYFNSKIHFIVPKETDEYFLNQLKRNIAFAKKYLLENGINSTTHISEGGSFAKEVIKFAAKSNADLISIMNLHRDTLVRLFGGGYEQQIITNDAQIPVMCVNPKDTSVSGGKGLFS